MANIKFNADSPAPFGAVLPAPFGAVFPAPFGAVNIITQDQTLLACALFSERISENIAPNAFSHSIANQVKAYLANPQSPLSATYDIKGTSFQQHVWTEISRIPVGQVLSYSQLADKVGSGPRAVANACGANPIPLFIPCHRVVAKLNVNKNSLGGFMQGKANGLAIKQWLLAHEGFVF